MKRILITGCFTALFATTALQFSACKDKQKETTTETSSPSTLDSATTAKPDVQPPVINSSDDSLSTALKDATKDYPGVTATVNNSEVTLTGTVSKSSLPKLMMAVNALHPKKVNNQLTTK